MNTHPRLKMITYCVGVALAQWAAAPALADSGVGVDTALGNALNPPGRSSVPRALDTEAFDSVRHSPTGQLYGVPYDDNEAPSKTEGGWEYTGTIEAGVVGGDGDKKNAAFRQYRDSKNGATLNYFEAEANKPDTATYVQAVGGGAGQHDQFYGFQFGRYNDWRVKLFYSETIHVFTDTYKSLYNGQGTGNLTLPAGLGAAGATPYTAALPVGTTGGTVLASGATYVGPTVTAGNNCNAVPVTAPLNTAAATPCWSYGGKIYQNGVALAAIDGVAGTYNNSGALVAGSAQSNMAAAINGQLAATSNSELALVRKKGGARFDFTLTDNWKGYASVTEEKRTGSRPFSMNYGSGNLTVEIPEPIDYTTSDFLAGLQYVDKLTSVNLRASGSVFHNNIDVLTIANPLFSPATGLGVVTQSTFDLYPDNTAFNVKGEYARKLPDFFNGRFTASAAYGSNRQNDSLMAPLSGNGVLPTASAAPGAGYSNSAAVTAFNVNNWNTTAALSQSSANQRLDNKLLNLGLSLSPTDQLNVKGSLRHYETDNKADDGSGHQYTAYNPLTGQYGVGIKYNDSITTVVGSSTGLVGSPCSTPTGVVVPGCIWNGPAGVVGQGTNNPTGVVVYSLARDYKQDNYVLAADYDLGQRSNLEGSYEREDFTRAMRERTKTWEDKLKLSYVNRDFDVATLRASYEVDSRRGGDYNTGLLPNVPYYQQVAYGLALPGNSVTAMVNNYLASLAACNSTTNNTSGAAVLCGLPGYQISVANGTSPAAAAAASTALNNYLARYSAQGMKTDLADRDQNILNARLTYQARQDLDLGVMVQLKNAKYPSTVYGAEKDNLNSFNLDLNYQPSSSQQFTAYYSKQDGSRRTTANSGGGSCTTAGLGASAANFLTNCAMTTSGAAGSGMYPVTAVWNMDTKDSNDVLGFNFQQDLGKMKLGIDYTYGKGKTKINYDYGSSVLSAAQTALEVLAGNALPDMTTTQSALTLNLMVPIDKRLSARFMVRYEDFKIRDWHYNDVIQGAMQNLDGGTLLLDSGPTNFHASTVGVFLQYKL